MTTTVVRPVGYTGSLQQLEWNYGNGAQVTAYLWGGGGGGGGNDSNRGGYGSGGGYSVSSFTVNNGDILKVAVGGKGGAGASRVGGAAGGLAGASLNADSIFNSRTAVPDNPAIVVAPTSWPSWASWMNQYAVQTSSTSIVYTVNFPASQSYDFSIAADYGMSVYVDDALVASCTDYAGSYNLPSPASTTAYSVTAGNHTVRVEWANDGGTAAWALTISRGIAGYSGGGGGRAGYNGSSGGGGGGGGATVILLNDTVVSVAGGGGGGGGGGNAGAAVGQDAPGSRGQSVQTPGQNGQDKSGDGGGGGGGGGGFGGGQGGAVPGGDQGGYAGSYGTGNGTTTENPSGRTPAGTSSPYFSGGIGQGGLNTQPGTAGYAVFVFDLPGVYVNQGGTYTPVSKVWVKDSGVWKQPRSIYVKNGGTWRQVIGGMPPIFTAIPGGFGVSSRLFS